jgi:D-erythronate 2-dehydrogenase
MKIIITGAGGFVGSALAHRFINNTDFNLVLVDQSLADFYKYKDQLRIRLVEGQLQDSEVRAHALYDGADILFHLAAVPGGAAEANPLQSKIVNLDTTLLLCEEFSAVSRSRRFVFASTIAVLGASLPERVDDTSPISPALVYGTHKAMVELALADMARRGILDPVSLRLPGIVARPEVPSGLKTAFISNIFHVLQRNEPFTCPLSESATTWLMSIDRCVDNLVHAATMDSSLLPSSRAITLPALQCSMGDLAKKISQFLGNPSGLVSYEPDSNLEIMFGRYPPLETAAANNAGFSHDGSLENLLHCVFSRLEEHKFPSYIFGFNSHY